ncbi:MAG: tRNA glutamyl-Q(34) synthetase GluQRS [Pseudomonadota bacterium]
MGGYVGRFAPSPTGPLHAGSLVTAVVSYLQARMSGGQWLLRIEDIDPPREQPGAATHIIATLESYGFRWDGPIRFQSERLEHYRRQLDSIKQHTFWCQCSRRDIQDARRTAVLSHNGYPGTCRDAEATDGALRFRLDRPQDFDDLFVGSVRAARHSDDFVLWRRDDLPSYQWAVSVDDAEQGVTEVIRGEDLLSTTPRHIATLAALGAPPPLYGHVPIVTNEQGQKLSKQNGARALQPGKEKETLLHALTAIGIARETLLTADSINELWKIATANWRPEMLQPLHTIAAF